MRSSLNLWQQIAYNKRMSVFIIFLFGVFGVLLSLALAFLLDWPPQGAILIGAVLLLLMLIQYSSARSMVLRVAGARPLEHNEYPFISHSVEGLAIAAGLPAPKCYIIDSPAPNAFATGRNPEEGVIALTTGLIEKLNNEEIEAVIAHEMGHIKNYDIRLATLAIAFVGIVAIVSEIILRTLRFSMLAGGRRSSRRSQGGGQAVVLILALVLAILAPLFATLLHLTLSRQREFYADTSGAFLTRNPGALARALRKIGGDPNKMESACRSTAPLYIVNPLNKASTGRSWFSTHPPLADRIDILERLAYKDQNPELA